ncbi:MAG TPA: response regulator [Thermoanaerobaculia bacterium]|nr:response regulator [Thermoanaerobaculia bacterium]
MSQQETFIEQPAAKAALISVLIVDDNPLLLKLGRALLSSLNCSVTTASTWIELSESLKSVTPDIIFMDVNLQSVKGNRLAEVLKSQTRTRNIPIILMSDMPEKDIEALVPGCGANGWFQKPLTRERVSKALRQIQAAN